jgi:hypothetical protein
MDASCARRHLGNNAPAAPPRGGRHLIGREWSSRDDPIRGPTRHDASQFSPNSLGKDTGPQTSGGMSFGHQVYDDSFGGDLCADLARDILAHLTDGSGWQVSVTTKPADRFIGSVSLQNRWSKAASVGGLFLFDRLRASFQEALLHRQLCVRDQFRALRGGEMRGLIRPSRNAGTAPYRSCRPSPGSDEPQPSAISRKWMSVLASVPWSSVMRFTSTTCSDFGGS